MTGENGVADDFKNVTNGINSIKVNDPQKLEDFKNGLKETKDISSDTSSTSETASGSSQEKPTLVTSDMKSPTEVTIPNQEKAKTAELPKAYSDSIAALEEERKLRLEKIQSGTVKDFADIQIKLAAIKKGILSEEEKEKLKLERTKANQELGLALKEWEKAKKEKKQKEKNDEGKKKWMEIKGKYPVGTVWEHEGDLIKIIGFNAGSMEAHFTKKGTKETIKRLFKRDKIDGLFTGYTRVENEPEEIKTETATVEKPTEILAEEVKTAPESGEIFSEKEQEIIQIYIDSVKKEIEFLRNFDYVGDHYRSEDVESTISSLINRQWNKTEQEIIDKGQFKNPEKIQKVMEILKKEII